MWHVLRGDYSTEEATAAPAQVGEDGRMRSGRAGQVLLPEPYSSESDEEEAQENPEEYFSQQDTDRASRSQRRRPMTTWSRFMKSSTVSAIYAIWQPGRATGRPTGEVALVNAAR